MRAMDFAVVIVERVNLVQRKIGVYGPYCLPDLVHQALRPCACAANCEGRAAQKNIGVRYRPINRRRSFLAGPVIVDVPHDAHNLPPGLGASANLFPKCIRRIMPILTREVLRHESHGTLVQYVVPG